MSSNNPPSETNPPAAAPVVPLDEYGQKYFESYNYADRPLGRFSMYWFARRYYAALARRYAPPGGGKLLELGAGLGHLLGLLQDDFECVGIDIADYSVEQIKRNAPRAAGLVMSADDLSSFADGEFAVVVALHLVEHLPDPAHAIRQVNRILKPGGLFLFATPNPGYSLRRFKDPHTDAIGKDPTHINVQPPRQWRAWCEAAGFKVLRHCGDGLWDVPYFPVIPKIVQFGALGIPALFQVMTQTMFTPLTMGVNQIVVARKEHNLQEKP
ncbi:MAG: class I SAM-dependent methyltransferase [Chloroflexi bacterium]|nr:class I SAM-dependent methyltransferase [Chloroflexota bacterium]